MSERACPKCGADGKLGLLSAKSGECLNLLGCARRQIRELAARAEKAETNLEDCFEALRHETRNVVRARDAALDQAARVACEFVVALDLSGLRWDAHITIAQAIRALKTKATP